MSIYTYEELKRYNQVLLISGIIVVAFNLRAALTSVGPLVGIIRETLALPNWSIGILTSLPLFAFALMSPIAPKLGVKYSKEVVMIAGMIILCLGLLLRSVPFVPLLFGGTILLGIGIAVANVLLPGVIKERFPNRVPLMTSVYATAMGLFAALASGVSIPIAEGAGLGWQIALGIWVVPALAAIAIWVYFVKQRTSANKVRMHYVYASNTKMWRSPLAWQVAIFMGLQAFLYNVMITWLPDILFDYGVNKETAGWMLSFNQFIGLPASLLAPIIAGKFKSQQGMVIVLSLLFFLGFAGLLVGDSYQLMVASVIIMGIGSGGIFPLALAFLGMRAKDGQEAAELSGMAQAVGYFLAAVGPILMGYLVDATGSWTYPLITLLIVSILTLIVGLGAGRNRVVSDDFAVESTN
ncbi:MFS transporter [Virgibacillus sp. SK37]|uniref:CynX/NimT family MFS transporter n=1 Tax=Virgibacillus sp. SK37 TaxID=403957 RepID=UPI0004D0FBC7|nr:MFS transporter [Virgibacillus sp. SK37]AIF44969.1 transporter [Virgibacillus sp. SK37]MYL57016.1 MFS transporter [Virgibacillus halodenitrificans]